MGLDFKTFPYMFEGVSSFNCSEGDRGKLGNHTQNSSLSILVGMNMLVSH